jgi:hypothetical protein
MGFEETAAAVWHTGSVLKYLCWRGSANSGGELFTGVCSEHLVSAFFLSPFVIGQNHVLRVVEGRSLDAAFRPCPVNGEHAG